MIDHLATFEIASRGAIDGTAFDDNEDFFLEGALFGDQFVLLKGSILKFFEVFGVKIGVSTLKKFAAINGL